MGPGADRRASSRGLVSLQIKRGDIWWVDFPEPIGSGPGYRRPTVIVQANYFNRSQLSTIMVAACSGNLAFARTPGNLLLTASQSGLPRDSVVKLTQVMTIDRSQLTDWVSSLPSAIVREIDQRLRFTLDLDDGW
jgi:mRNA interferase MazF